MCRETFFAKIKENKVLTSRSSQFVSLLDQNRVKATDWNQKEKRPKRANGGKSVSEEKLQRYDSIP